MDTRVIKKFVVALSTMAMLSGGVAQAAFVLLDDMEGANNWSAFDGTPGSIVTDPAGSGNTVFSLGFGTNANNSDSYLSLGSGIADGKTATLFLRVRTTDLNGAFNWVFGSSDVANPGAGGTTSAWGNYEGYGVMDNTGGTNTELGVRDGGSFNFFGAASGDIWYNMWLVLNNTTDQTTLYYNTGLGTPATDPATVSATGAFRNGTTDALVNLWVRNNEADTTGYIDDVYLDTTGSNLVNPLAAGPEAIVWSNPGVSNVTATAAWPYATVSKNLTASWLVWDIEDKGNTNLLTWTGNRGNMETQSTGEVTGNATNLTADTEYFFRFYGEDATTNGWSGVATFASALSAAQKPAFTNAESTSATSIALDWDDNAETETAYVLQRADASDGPYSVIDTLAADTTTYVDANLTPSTTYYYRLSATNSVNGSGTDFADCQKSATTIEEIEVVLPPQTEILEVVERVNTYWMAGHSDYGDNRWANAAYYTGAMRTWEALQEPAIWDYVNGWGDKYDWTVYYRSTNPTHADEQCAGQTYIDVFRQEGGIDSNKIASITANIKIQLDRAAVDDWSWIDAFYMSAPVYARLGSVYSNTNYYEKLYAMYRHTGYERVTGVTGVSGLFDPAENLWYRDSNFVYPKKSSASGEKMFWARGNGWVLGSLVRVLDEIPANEPHRAEYEQMFTNMAAKLVSIQKSDGYWGANLLDVADPPEPEISGSAFFTYGLAWGVNNGLLDRATYEPYIVKAWNGMVSGSVHADGFLGWVQPEDADPYNTWTYNTTRNYGVGAFLLAGIEVARMHGSIPPRVYIHADAGGDRVIVDTDNNGFEPFVLDGSGSTAVNDTLESYNWYVDGTWVAGTVTNTIVLGQGTRELILVVQGYSGIASTDTVSVVVAPVSSPTAFVLLDDMEGANNWSAFDGTPGTIGTDPANLGNTVFSLGFGTHANDSDSYLSLGSGIADGTTGTLFLRVRTSATAGSFNWVFGSSDIASPGASGTTSAWGNYEGYGVMDDTLGTSTQQIGVRDGTSFKPFGPASGDTWYNVWLVLNNATDQTMMYYNTGLGTPATDPATVSATGAFRNGTTNSLINLFVRNSRDGTTGYIDDVYLDTTGSNLVNPTFTSTSPEMKVLYNEAEIEVGATNALVSVFPPYDPSIHEYLITNLATAEGTLYLTDTPVVVFKESGSTSHNGFTISAPPGSTNLVPGASTTFTVTFAATVIGSYTATVSIANSDTDKNPYEFEVTATASFILKADFTNDSGADKPLSFIDWRAWAYSNTVSMLSDYSDITGPVGIAPPSYAFFAPKLDLNTANSPALFFTSNFKAFPVSSLLSNTVDIIFDNIDAEARFAVMVAGVWYVTDAAYADTRDNTGPNGDWVPRKWDPTYPLAAANWRVLDNAAIGSGSALSVGAQPGTDLDGDVSAVGLYMYAGINLTVDGDHARMDNFIVYLSPFFPRGTMFFVK